jgi:hypothetical protein
MIVMMTARTPSLNASKRLLFISSRPFKTRNKLFFAVQLYAGNKNPDEKRN